MNNFGRVPCGLLIDILSRLETKDLCRFRCVSKQWLSIISSDPHLKKQHRFRSLSNPKLLSWIHPDSFYGSRGNLRLQIAALRDRGFSDDYNLSIRQDSSDWLIFGSDLLCAIVGKSVRVCNPSTHEVIRLPDCLYSSSSYLGGFGLGYVPSRNEYKIVRLVETIVFGSDLNRSCFSVEIFTLKEGRSNEGWWRSIESCPPVTLLCRRALCVSGVMYWLYQEQGSDDEKVLCFDLNLNDEEFTSLPCPEGYPGLIYDEDGELICSTDLIELKGFLCLAYYSAEVSTTTIWIHKVDQPQLWIKECVIDLEDMGDHCSTLGYVPFDDYVGEIVIWSSHEELQGTILLYNIEKGTIRRIEHLTFEESDQLPFLHWGTLFSLQRSQGLFTEYT